MSELVAAVPAGWSHRSWAGLVQGGGAAVLAGGLAVANGGYFPTSWSWTALLLAWVGLAALLVQPRLALSRFELGLLASLTALTAWVWLSTLWSVGTERSFLDGERMLVFFSGVAVVLLIGRISTGPVLGGLVTGMTLVSGYGLATRLFPERLGSYDPISAYRLARPIGYWNALGLYAVIAAILALALAARARSVGARALAAATLPVLLPTLYFTYSRGSWIVLAFGLLVALAIDPRRLQLVTALVIATPAAVAVWLALHARPLTHERSALAAASAAGHRLAVEIVVLAALAAAASIALTVAERRLRIGPRVRTTYGAALGVVALAGLLAIFVRFGSPATLAERGYRAFVAPPPMTSGNLNERLVSFSGTGRAPVWHAAGTESEAYPVLGSGAGTFDTWWNAHRHSQLRVRDAHNLYLETLAELGPIGLALLVSLLALPLVAAIRARKHPFIFGAIGAYAAFLLHAGVDWDWEIPAVTLPALVIGALCVRAAAGQRRRMALGRAARIAGGAALVAVSGIALVALVGNTALAKSHRALLAGDFVQAQRQAQKALAWMPWSAQAWERLGETQVQTLQLADARVSFRRALEKEPDDWVLWYELSSIEHGADRRRAARQVVRLNPHSAEADQLRKLLGS